MIWTTSINQTDRLVNGLIGRVMEFKSTGTTLKVIYVKVNYEKAYKMTMQCDTVARQNCWVSIEKVETSFSLRNNKVCPTIKRIQFPLILFWV